MYVKEKLKKFFLSEWIIALLLLGIYFSTNGYLYAWDDQHLEIPMLKKLIDVQLYQGDYYIDSLLKNFPSFFYRILAKLISIEQIPTAYFVLFTIARFFLFFWIYKLWLYISKNRFSAFICSIVFILLGRVEEFLYRTFSHQEFGLAIIFAGIYYFYRERFVLASVILGIAANIHAIYSVFPMAYLCLYLLLDVKRHKLSMLLKCIGAFLVCALPVLIVIFQKYSATHLSADSPILEGWMELYKIACPQNFIFLNTEISTLFNSWNIFIDATQKFVLLFGLYIFNLIFHKSFRNDLKTQSVAVATIILLVISFVFTYIWPSRFILDLNLVRNSQFLLFLVMGYSALLFIQTIQTERIFVGFLTALFLALLRYGDTTALLAMIGLFAVFTGLQFVRHLTGKKKIILLCLLGTILFATIFLTINYFRINPGYGRNTKVAAFATFLFLAIASGTLWLIRQKSTFKTFKNGLIVIPLVVLFMAYTVFHFHFKKVFHHGEGFWQLQRNWIDMQIYVKNNTPKNALLLVPHNMEMGGFRIQSERKIICSYRDCGIIGFDYRAAVEWQDRLNDIKNFEVFVRKPIADAIKSAILEYRVNYIVFMNYMGPPKGVNVLEQVYENSVFTLYRVKTIPVPPLK